MLVLRCTQKLLVRLKQTGDMPAVESTTRLATGTATSFGLAGVSTCCSSASGHRLPVVLPIGEAKRLTTVFPDAVCEVLVNVGIAAADIADEDSQMLEIVFGRTVNRSVLGTMNDVAFMAQHGSRTRDEPESPEELMQFLSQTPILPLDGASPIALTKAVFQARSGH
jgi:hypothetical protein